MAVQLARPDRITVRFAGHGQASGRRRLPRVASTVEATTRGLVVGIAVGALLISGHSGVVAITTIGILGIGAGLMSWGE